MNHTQRRGDTAAPPPPLLTAGRIASKLRRPLHRVTYVLRTRDIRPSATAGTLRLYDLAAVARVRHELSGIEARADRRRVANAPDAPPRPPSRTASGAGDERDSTDTAAAEGGDDAR